MQYTYKYQSSLGGITLESDGKALIGLWFDGEKYFNDKLLDENKEKDLPIFEQTKYWLDVYFSGKKPDFTPPIVMNGSDFRIAVWNILLSLPYGELITYSEIANMIAKEKGINKMSAQAIGGAVGHNRISIIIPCHRVVGKNGSLTGYAGGIDKKIELLRLENVNMDNLFIP